MFAKEFLSEETIYELNIIKEFEQQINRNNLIYKTGDKKKDANYDFRKFKTIRFFLRKSL